MRDACRDLHKDKRELCVYAHLAGQVNVGMTEVERRVTGQAEPGTEDYWALERGIAILQYLEKWGSSSS